jgi:hypothetical protein
LDKKLKKVQESTPEFVGGQNITKFSGLASNKIDDSAYNKPAKSGHIDRVESQNNGLVKRVK